MALPDFTMRTLLEAGAHFGHQSHRWNPKMAPYIFGTRNSIHILDLTQTVPLLHRALQSISDVVGRGGRILFVGTKRQASDSIAEAAKRAAQYYINSRWLGGMLTNWKTISASISRLRKIEEQLSAPNTGQTKKERLILSRELAKLERALGGIKDMGGLPDLVFIVDTNKEQLAIKEANRLRIPVAAIVDTNSDPDGITFPIPGNDDSARAIALYCDLVSRAAIEGLSRSQSALEGSAGSGEEKIGTGQILESLPELEASPSQSGKRFELLTAPRGAPDDFTQFQGIGPHIIKKLNEGGIYHFWQIAAMNAEDLQEIDQKLKLGGRLQREGWVSQAQEWSSSTS